MRLPKYIPEQPHLDSVGCELFLVSNIYNPFGLDTWYKNQAPLVEKLRLLLNVFQAMYGYLCGKDINTQFFNDILIKVKYLVDNIDSEKEENKFNEFYNNIANFYKNILKYKKDHNKVPHIFILTGNPGSGKSHIARLVAKENTNVEVIKKYSTRQVREDEKGDVVETQAGCTPQFVANLNYNYTFEMRNEKNLSGVSKQEIEKALNNGKNVFIASTSLDLYEQIEKDFPCQVHLIEVENPLYNPRTQKEIFETQGRSKEEIENRLGLSTNDDVHKFDYNLRTIVNPIMYLKDFDPEKQKLFILNQVKYILEAYGSELNLDIQPSDLLDDFDNYFLTCFRNTKYLYPFISGRYAEQMDYYVFVEENDSGTPKI